MRVKCCEGGPFLSCLYLALSPPMKKKSLLWNFRNLELKYSTLYPTLSPGQGSFSGENGLPVRVHSAIWACHQRPLPCPCSRYLGQAPNPLFSRHISRLETPRPDSTCVRIGSVPPSRPVVRPLHGRHLPSHVPAERFLHHLVSQPAHARNKRRREKNIPRSSSG